MDLGPQLYPCKLNTSKFDSYSSIFLGTKIHNYPNIVLRFPKSRIFPETNGLMVGIVGELGATQVSHMFAVCFLVYGSSMVFPSAKWE